MSTKTKSQRRAEDETRALSLMSDDELIEYVRGGYRRMKQEATEHHRRPEPRRVELSQESSVMVWVFPRGMRDAEIKAEIVRQGWDTEGWPCRCVEGDCCGASFGRSVTIQQGRNVKRAELFIGRCI
jgi:hypothetical protein